MRIGRIAAAAFLAVCQAVTVFADAQLYTVYNSQTEEVKINGSFDSTKSAVTVMILPSGESHENITAEKISDNKYITKQLACDENGKISLRLNMPDYMKSGSYVVYAASDGVTATAEFNHVSKKDVSDVLVYINSAQSPSELEKVLADNAEKVGIGSDCLKYCGHIARILFAVKPNGGYTADGFLSEKNCASAIALLAGGEDFKKVITSYGDYFDFSYDTEKDGITAECEKKLAEFLSGGLPEKSCRLFFWRCLLMSRVVVSESYVTMRSVIEDCAKNAEFDMTDYNLLSETKKTDVMRSVFSKSPASYSVLAEVFESSVKSAEDKKTSGGGGGGGGSSSSGGGVSSIGSKPTEQKPAHSGYSDMENHWSREYVQILSDKGIVSGFEDNTFRPENYVTRAEYIKLAVCALGMSLTSNRYFNDVADGDWYFKYVSCAKDNGMADGFDGNFRPDELITREDAAVILYRALKSAEKGDISSFADSGEISSYAADAVGTLSGMGIINGYNSEFMPKANAKRSEAAAMICRFLNVGSERTGTVNE